MSQGYVPGPAQVFVGVGAADALVFLGYSENGVEVNSDAAFRPVYSDFGGPDKPVDSQYMGEDATITMTLNKYNEAILKTCMQRAVASGNVAGSIGANQLGSLMVAQSYSFQLVVYSPYSGLSYQSATIRPCYDFGAAWLTGNVVDPISTLLKAPRIVFYAIPVWNSTALTAVLYSNTTPSLPSVN